MFGSFHSACPKACPTAGTPINPAVPASGWRVTWFSTGTTHRHASTGNQAFYYYLMKMQKLSQIFQTIFIPLLNLHTVLSKAFFFFFLYTNNSLFQPPNLSFSGRKNRIEVGSLIWAKNAANTPCSKNWVGGSFKKIKWCSGIFKINLQIFISNSIWFSFFNQLKKKRNSLRSSRLS